MEQYVMSSGTAELRKGVDLFVDAAIVLLNKKADIHFVWTGEFQNKELECWMKDQIRRSGFEENFHFVRFVKDSEEYGESYVATKFKNNEYRYGFDYQTYLLMLAKSNKL